jgi:hypothetical protein
MKPFLSNLKGGRSSEVKLPTTNSTYCIVQRAAEQPKTGFFCDCGVAEASPGFQAGWST